MEKKPVGNSTHLIIIGGSSGSLDALLLMLPKLDKKFAVPIVIILHRSAGTTEAGLVELLKSRTSLQVKEADEKDRLLAGWIYIAPADYHLLFEEDATLSLDASQKVNYSRPSIDVSFISAAEVYQERLTAVLLSGANADGAKGMRTVQQYQGRNIVQDPAEALVAFMPEQALPFASSANVLRSLQIVESLNEFSRKLR